MKKLILILGLLISFNVSAMGMQQSAVQKCNYFAMLATMMAEIRIDTRWNEQQLTTSISMWAYQNNLPPQTLNTLKMIVRVMYLQNNMTVGMIPGFAISTYNACMLDTVGVIR